MFSCSQGIYNSLGENNLIVKKHPLFLIKVRFYYSLNGIGKIYPITYNVNSSNLTILTFF